MKYIKIEVCNNCPHFNWESYHKCVILGKIIPSDKKGTHHIPEDCPLENLEN